MKYFSNGFDIFNELVLLYVRQGPKLLSEGVLYFPSDSKLALPLRYMAEEVTSV